MKAKASIALLATEAGGLSEPMPTPCKSLLLHIQEDSGISIGVGIWTDADIPLQPATYFANVELNFWDDATAHLYIRSGVEFTLRYPNQIVGTGRIVEVLAF